MFATESAANRFTVYRHSADKLVPVLGRHAATPALRGSAPLDPAGETLYVEAHELPGANFEGLITLDLYLLYQEAGNTSIAAEDRVVLRVAPWIMTPNTLAALRVYACDMRNAGGGENTGFLRDLSAALADLNVPLNVVPPDANRNDRWIQDELEFGYCQAPSHLLNVAFNSPRDRGLEHFVREVLPGPDMGHFTRGGSAPNSLDAFGNLEVSPPVKASGRIYPFGRIVFGGRQIGDFAEHSRQMMPELRRFLYAQKVQAPLEVYTDWLAVGHVDEIVSFVSGDNGDGFKLLLAWPDYGREILEQLSRDGHGDVVMFKGRRRGHPNSSESAEITIDALLGDGSFWEANDRYQEHMKYNRAILARELGLTDFDIVEIPVLFQKPDAVDGRTLAYFPDMVNHLVVGNASLVPKPYGPVVNGKCAFEAAFERALPWRDIRFIEDWYSYHELSGEVHCATNTLRAPFSTPWWRHKPDGAFDI